MKLRDSIIIKRPVGCDDCPFYYRDSKEGDICQGEKSLEIKRDGKYFYISNPEDALKYGFECAFVDKEDKK